MTTEEPFISNIFIAYFNLYFDDKKFDYEWLLNHVNNPVVKIVVLNKFAKRFRGLVEKDAEDEEEYTTLKLLLQINTKYQFADVLFIGNPNISFLLSESMANYFDNESFRQLISRFGLLQLDASMEKVYEPLNHIQRYLFDDMVIRELCTYMEPVKKKHIASLRYPIQSPSLLRLFAYPLKEYEETLYKEYLQNIV